MYRNVDYVVKETGTFPGESNFWDLGYVYVSKPGYIVVKGEWDWECIMKKDSPGGEFILQDGGRPMGESFCGLTTSHMGVPAADPSLGEEGLEFWDPKKLNTKGSLADPNGLKIASTCEYMRRVGEGVPEWVEVADRHEGDWMVPCVVLEGGAIVYPKSSKGELVETMCCGDETGMVAPPCAWSSSPKPDMYGSGVVSEDLLKSAIHAIKVASKVSPPAEAAEVDDASSESSEKPKRKADAPAAEKPEKKPKADSAVEKEAETTSTSSPSARPEVVDLTKEDD